MSRKPKATPTPVVPKLPVTRGYSREDVVKFLAAEIDRLGSQAAFSRAWHVSQSYVSEVLAGTRDPGPAILTVFKLAQRKLFVPVEE
jgi:hypothetical protein